MKKIIVILGLILFLAPKFALADGMIMPRPDYYIYESDQRAVILYEDSTQIETMVLSIKFQGNADDFAWIIPLPGEPSITKGSDELFTALSELTASQYYDYRYSDVGLGLGATEKAGQPVTVIQTQKVDYYDITTLTSTDSQALVKWLNLNGYQYPSSGQYVFNSYIQNNWYFVAIKIDTSALTSSAGSDLKEGHATPIKFTFQAKNLVYPLKISSVVGDTAYRRITNTNANTNTPVYIEEETEESLPSSESVIYPYYPSSVDVELYILADHKKTLPSFTTAYANWVKKDTIEKWAVDDQGDPLLSPQENKYFLTKLTRYMTYEQMSEDLFPRDAADNKKVTGSSTVDWYSFENLILFILAFSLYSVFVFVLGIFSPFGLAFIIFTLIQFRAKSRAWRIIAWIVQIKVTLIYLLVAGLIFLAYLADPYNLADMPRTIISGSSSISSLFSSTSALWFLTLFIPFLILLAGLIMTMIWQVRYQKKKSSVNNIKK